MIPVIGSFVLAYRLHRPIIDVLTVSEIRGANETSARIIRAQVRVSLSSLMRDSSSHNGGHRNVIPGPRPS